MPDVTTSIINWREYCLEKWGQEYNIPETVYKFTGGMAEKHREFKSTDNSSHGVYERS